MAISYTGQLFLSRMQLYRDSRDVLETVRAERTKLESQPMYWWSFGLRREIRYIKRRERRTAAHTEALQKIASDAYLDWVEEAAS